MSGSRLHVEALEARALLSANSIGNLPDGPTPLQAQPMMAPIAAGPQAGYSPSVIQTAYSMSGSALTGAGQTIAIVDAFDDPTIARDLQTFDQAYGLPAANLSKVEMTSAAGQTPVANAAWSAEIALDVEWAHAVAPGASILLVEAYDSSVPDLMAAVNYAANAPGVSVVSMSWGVSEFAGETAYDSDFTTPAGHTPVAFVAAAGDSGPTGGADWPAVSQQVLGVGGTTLTVSANGAYSSESVWSGSSSGVSNQVSEPPYQLGVQSTGARTSPDVSYDANPSTGFAVYNSSAGGQSGWEDLGGTSAGAPQWAGLIALADEGRAAAGEPNIGSAPAAVYSLPSSDFNSVDTVTTANNSVCLVSNTATASSTLNTSTATGGAAANDVSTSSPASSTPAAATLAPSSYNPQAGLGSPVANLVVNGLVTSGTSTLTASAGEVVIPMTLSGDAPVSGPWTPPQQSSGRAPSGPAVGVPGNAQPLTVLLFNTPTNPPATSSPTSPTVAVTLPASDAAVGLTPAQAAATAAPVLGTAAASGAPTDSTLNSLGTTAGNPLRPLERNGSGPGSVDTSAEFDPVPSNLPGHSGTEHGWAAAGRSPQSKAAVASPRSMSGRPAAVEDDADALAAIDNCFASGQWVEQILAAHPTTALPAGFSGQGEADLDLETAEAAIAQVAAEAAEGTAGGWTVPRGWLAAALGLGAYWQMRRSAKAEQTVAGGSAPAAPSTISLQVQRVASAWKSGRVRVK